jgi:hypothetical protein
MRPLGFALAVGLGALLLRCGSFSSTDPEPPLDASSDAGAGDGGGDAARGPDGAADGALAVGVRCGETTCDVTAGEVCCVFRLSGTTNRRAVCAPEGTCPPLRQGETLEVEAKCDGPGDCGPGLVCCHVFKSCGAEALESASCVAPSNCSLCGADAGPANGKLPCDPAKGGECAGTCRGDQSLVAAGYCE